MILTKKKILKKVRTNFLAKRPESEEHTLASVPKFVNPFRMQMISGSFGLVEQDRNIHMGLKYLNLCLDVNNIKIQDVWSTKQIVLRPRISSQASMVPWEYSVKRLESYGDLDLATLAHKMRAFNEKYEHLIGEYHKLMKSDKRETKENVEKARINTRDSTKKIESGYPFMVMKFLYDSSGINLHSMTFNEAILEEIEQSVEGFARWAQSSGIPMLFPHAEKLPLAQVKKIVSQDILLFSEVGEEPEFEAFISDKNGNQRRVVIQNARICERTESGFLISFYTILKNCRMQQNVFEVEDEIKEEYDRRGMKWVKYENQLEMGMEQMWDKMMD